MMTPSLQHIIRSNPAVTAAAKLRDRSGASIIIALSFFLICAIIGSVVLTAASVNAQQVTTHKETQQTNYSVSSAAQLVGNQLHAGEITTFTYAADAASGKAGGSAGASGLVKPLSETVTNTSPLLQRVYGSFRDPIWDAVLTGTSYSISGAITITPPTPKDSRVLQPVYAWVTFEKDFSLTVTLSLDPSQGAASPYNETVALKCIPTYDGKKLTKLQWEAPVITKSGGA
ncbi:MAG: hypothetical protein RRX88_06730 [Raoultibacter sp.]